MRAFVASLVLGAASCASAAPATESYDALDERPASSLALHVGRRGLGGDDWDPVEHEGLGGLEFVHEPPGSVVGIEAAFFTAGRTEDNYLVPPALRVDYLSRTTELSFGLHKELPVEYAGVHPYFGGGLSALHAQLRGAENGAEHEDEGDSIGVYLHGGIEFDASSAIFLGLDLRLRGGTEVDLLGEDRSTGYGQVAIMLGVRF